MTAEAARELLALRVDWGEREQSFAEYVAGGASFVAAASVLRFDLGWITWSLLPMMDVIAAMKDGPGTDRLTHHQPTYDAWFASGTFFVEAGRWAYVGAGPMFDVASGSYDRPAYVGPDSPSVADVRVWNVAGPLARSVCIEEGVWLAIETVRGERFRCGTWMLPDAVARALDDDGPSGGASVRIARGGTKLAVNIDGVTQALDVRALYAARDAIA